MNTIRTILVMLMIFVPLTIADTGMYPYGSEVFNSITNINDFPDIVFVSSPDHLGQCSGTLEVIGSDGVIPSIGCYRDDIESRSVYAVKKRDFNNGMFSTLGRDERWNYLISLDPIKVLARVPSNTAVRAKTSAVNEYAINSTLIEQWQSLSPSDETQAPDVSEIYSEYYARILITFALTFLIEFIVVIFFFRIWKVTNGIRKIALYTFLINLLTWPLANLILINFLYINIYLTEIIVIAAESLLFIWAFKLEYAKALLLSFLANTASALIGSIILLFIM
jgi:hypothetical protein